MDTAGCPPTVLMSYLNIINIQLSCLVVQNDEDVCWWILEQDVRDLLYLSPDVGLHGRSFWRERREGGSLGLLVRLTDCSPTCKNVSYLMTLVFIESGVLVCIRPCMRDPWLLGLETYIHLGSVWDLFLILAVSVSIYVYHQTDSLYVYYLFFFKFISLDSSLSYSFSTCNWILNCFRS